MESDEDVKERAAFYRWAVEMGLIGITAAVALGAATTQLSSLNSGLDSSAAAAVYSQQQEIDDIFVERPGYLTYFDEGTQV